jgi:hypothetical protein
MKPTIQQQIRCLIGEKKQVMDEARETLKKEVPSLTASPTRIILSTSRYKWVAKQVGNTYANFLIDEFKLERRGWRKESEHV